MTAFSYLVGQGGSPRAAIRLGQGDIKGAQAILGNCAAMLTVVGVALSAVLMLFSKQLLVLLGASEAALPYAMDYINIYLLGSPFVMLALGLNSFIAAQGHAAYSMVSVLVGAVINIVLDPLFIFTFGFGIRGAAIATVLAQSASALWILAFLCGKKTTLRLLARNLRVRMEIMLPVLTLGISPFVMCITESFLSMAFNTSLQSYGGDIAVASMAVLTAVAQLVNMPTLGLTQGGQSIISYNFGARKVQRVQEAYRLLRLSCNLFTFAFWALMMLAPRTLIGLFSTDETLIAYTVWAARIYFAVSFVRGNQTACQNCFIAIGQAKASITVALMRKLVLLIPLIYVLPLFFADKVFGVLLAEPVADLTVAVFTLLLFRKVFNRELQALAAQDEALPSV